MSMLQTAVAEAPFWGEVRTKSSTNLRSGWAMRAVSMIPS
jgi:hypothetical protein